MCYRGGRTSAGRFAGQCKTRSLRIGFFGDGPWAYNALNLLSKDQRIDIAFVALRNKSPDQVLKGLATSKGLRCITPANINHPEFLGWTDRQQCDLLVSMSYDQIFKKEIINQPPQGIINCHAGKLPFYRGRNILNWALINDEKEFGITVHYVDEGIDTGDILVQHAYPITDTDTYATLLEIAHSECPSVLLQAVDKIIAGDVQAVPQNSIHPVGTYCTIRKPGDEILDWGMTSREVFNFVRAVCEPGPMARTWLGEDEVCINKVEMVLDAPVYKGIPGAVLFLRDQMPYVKTGDSVIKIVDYRMEDRCLRAGDRLCGKHGEASGKRGGGKG
jgi:methionyl-tRNA formyltransferase